MLNKPRQMDPDRYQMRDLKRRMVSLEKKHTRLEKHTDRLGLRIHQQKKDLEEQSLTFGKEIDRLKSVVSDMHARFPKDLWEQ